jgi:cyclopropane-fatty-acyl-phospholipid synthase
MKAWTIASEITGRFFVSAKATAPFFVSARPVSARKARKTTGSKIKWNFITSQLYPFAMKAPFEGNSIQFECPPPSRPNGIGYNPGMAKNKPDDDPLAEHDILRRFIAKHAEPDANEAAAGDIAETAAKHLSPRSADRGNLSAEDNSSLANPSGNRADSVLKPDFESVQAHYDLSDEFFSLFLDPSMTYSCAKFDKPDLSLEEAQRAKIDLTLKKCELRPGCRLLDVGCGWGSTALRANELYNAHVVALTLSRNQYEYAQRLASGRPGIEFRLQGWEEFDEKVDRIVSIGAMEHFGVAKYAAFFERCHRLLPDHGILVLHLITLGKPTNSFAFFRFVHFLSTKIFPNGFVPPPEVVIERARAGGFELVHAESLRHDYAQTLDCWLNNLVKNQRRAAAVTSEANVSMYMKYLAGCARYFRSGEVNIHQFKLRKI